MLLLLIWVLCIALVANFKEGISSDDEDMPNKLEVLTEMFDHIQTTRRLPTKDTTSKSRTFTATPTASTNTARTKTTKSKIATRTTTMTTTTTTTSKKTTTMTTTTTATATTTTPSPRKIICTVSETLLVGDPITNGLCDYAVFSDLDVVGGNLEPVKGNDAWEVFKTAVATSNTTLGGVSFSPLLASDHDGTLQKLLNLDNSKLEELVVEHKMLALGTLGVNHNFSYGVDAFTSTFKHLRSVLDSRPSSITFLGLWLFTTDSARVFAKSLGDTQDIDFIIIQTHVTTTAHNGPCQASMISQTNQDGEFPNFSAAREAVTGLRQLGNKDLRVLFSSTMVVMVYVGAKGGPNVDFDNRVCELSFVADINATCRETLGARRISYDSRDMSYYISFRKDDIGYMYVFEKGDSLKDKAKKYGILTDGWAFFDVHRDTYWPCSRGKDYDRVKLGVAYMREQIPPQY